VPDRQPAWHRKIDEVAGFESRTVYEHQRKAATDVRDPDQVPRVNRLDPDMPARELTLVRSGDDQSRLALTNDETVANRPVLALSTEDERARDLAFVKYPIAIG
jgi:hypothetical protein